MGSRNTTKSLKTVHVRFCGQTSYKITSGVQNFLNIRTADKGLQTGSVSNKVLGSHKGSNGKQLSGGDRKGITKKAQFRLKLEGEIGASVNKAGEHFWQRDWQKQR